MENAEGIFGSIKKWLRFKGSTPKPAPDILQPPVSPGWSHEMFREYLLALSRGREFLLPVEEYPSRIELSPPWHEAFNQIRPNSYEGWILIGFQEGQRRLILPRVAEKGLSHLVPAEVMAVGLEKARTKAGITDLVGDVHSHPRDFRHASWHIPSGVTSEGEGTFSLADLYGLLYALGQQRPSDTRRSIMFVVEGNENIVAFASRRSLELVRSNFSGSYESFAKEWYEKYGWTFKEMGQASGEMAKPARPDASKVWAINKAIAHSYQLALYRGFKDGPLLRDHPARI